MKTLTAKDVTRKSLTEIVRGDIIPDGIVANVASSKTHVTFTLTNGSEVFGKVTSSVDVIARVSEALVSGYLHD